MRYNNSMKIFHGSDTAVPEPRIIVANRLLDFGEGFYTTSSKEQAKRWAARVKTRRNSKNQIISVYELNLGKAEKDLKILRFDSTNPEWLRFVTACRIGKDAGYSYDMAMGSVANDNVYATIQLFETGLLSEQETIARLKVEEIYDQILFHTARALQYCVYVGHESAEDASDG